MRKSSKVRFSVVKCSEVRNLLISNLVKIMRTLYQEALEALALFHKCNPDVYDADGKWVGVRRWQQPCSNLTKATWKYVYLFNTNGLIAKYNRKSGEIII